MRVDRVRWDSRYRERYPAGVQMPGPRSWLASHRPLLTGGRALDLACGVGRNAVFAAECGYVVDAVDISTEALARLKREVEEAGLPVNPIQADLDYFPLPRRVYDLVMVFYFLDRRLFRPIGEALVPGGLLIYETFNMHFLRVMPDVDPARLLRPAELCRAFDGWEILDYRERTEGDRPTSAIVARKPEGMP